MNYHGAGVDCISYEGEIEKFKICIEQVTQCFMRSINRSSNESSKEVMVRENIAEKMHQSGHLTQNINDPARESEILSMYSNLRVPQWARIYGELCSIKDSDSSAANKIGNDIIEKIIGLSQMMHHKMDKDISNTVSLYYPSSSEALVQKKIQKHRKLLQTRLLQQSEDLKAESATALDSVLDEINFDIPLDLKEKIKGFVHKFFLVACLMLLHNPSLTLEISPEDEKIKLQQSCVVFPAVRNNKDFVCPRQMHPPGLFQC
ncbi:uncharacterized protein LOC114645142 isoform X2 [Erpetoichthys calabaricus]|uniref:uncharacterized protein LOC114645142 isoform X2 n=1 Tax=Erpetoichthys calabaricus TaxID=27687 RepID=UPI00109F3A08|nr:uncharacterized protein LOC114645142 isoform X2 [Erpetoichthys calabaricus]